MSKNRKKRTHDQKQINWYIVVQVVLSILVVIVSAVIVVNKDSMGNTNVVLAFFGILATFIVIGNFSQVNAIKADYLEQQRRFKVDMDRAKGIMTKMKKEVLTASGESKFQALNTKIDSISQNETELLKQIDEGNTQKKNENYLLTYLINGDHRTLLLDILQGKTCRCNVKYAGKNHIANAFKLEDSICFDIKDALKTTDVEYVNGKVYDKKIMTRMLEIFNSMQNN